MSGTHGKRTGTARKMGAAYLEGKAFEAKECTWKMGDAIMQAEELVTMDDNPWVADECVFALGCALRKLSCV